jgi:adenylate kinase
MNTIDTVLFVGRPGSGKGTQAKKLCDKAGWLHFSTGDRFKALRDDPSALGTRVREAYDAGRLLPDWFATYLFEHQILDLKSEQGIVCDGYPRSLAQAEIFDEILTWLARPYVVIDLMVSEDEAIRRQLERAKVEHRPDSTSEEKIKVRMEAYENATRPILDFFREKGLVTEIDGEQSPEEVERAIDHALGRA